MLKAFSVHMRMSYGSVQASPRHPQRAAPMSAAVAERLDATAAQPLLLDVDQANQHVREGHYEAELVELQVSIGLCC